MRYDPKTFCAAPWFQIKTAKLGEFRVCNNLDTECSRFPGRKDYSWPDDSADQYMSSDYVGYLRQQLTTGHRLPECHRCWQEEDHGGKSLREKNNDSVTVNRGHALDQTWIEAYFRQKHNWNHDDLLTAEIKLSNVCNFSCAMCEPADSSQIYTIWRSNQQHPMVRLTLDRDPLYLDRVRTMYRSRPGYQMLSEILQRKPQHLRLLGGEPLLDQTMLDILQSQPTDIKNSVSLMFTTNGSTSLTDTADLLHGYRDVNFVVSLEGLGAVQDYIRRGSVWQQVQANILAWEKVCRMQGKLLPITVTVQALNLYHVPDIVAWSRDLAVQLSFNILQEPDFMSLKAMPPGFRQQCISRLQQVKNEWRSWNQDQPAKGLDLAAIALSVDHDPDLLERLKQFLHWYDPDQSWRTVLPEWHQYF